MTCLSLSARFFSLFLWPVCYILWFVPKLVTLPSIRDERAVFRSDFAKFDKQKDPVWFAHITDLHIAPYLEESATNLRDSFRLFNKLNPEQIFITGDIANTYSKSAPPWDTKLDPDHFGLYVQIKNETVANKSKLFEVIGNHDTWGVTSFDRYIAKDMFGLDCRRYAQTKEVSGGTRLIMFNPEYPPISTGDMMNFWIPPYPETLDALETELGKETTSKTTLVMLHQTTEMFIPVARSTISNRTFVEILEDPKFHVAAIINGHTHPVKPEFRRYHNFIECTQVCLKENRLFGIATVDNERFSYTTLDLDQNHHAVVTYPIANDVTAFTYSKDDFQVRLISFSDEDKHYSICGDIEGTMKKTRKLCDNVWLYTFDANIEDGKHQIQISGDYNVTINFTIGADIEGRTHVREKPFNAELFNTFLFIGSFLYLSMLIPAFLPSKWFVLIDRANHWMVSGQGESYFFISVIFGNLCTARRLPYHLNIAKMLLVAFVSDFILPVIIFKVDGIWSTIWIYGYFIGNVFRRDIMTRYYMLCSLDFILMPLLLFASLAYFGWQWVHIIPILICSGVFAYAYETYIKYGYDVDPDHWFLSPMYIWFPIILLFMITVTFFRSRHKKHHSIKEE